MKFKLDYEKWICGSPDDNDDKECCHGKGQTGLLNQEGYMCCLGQFCEQLGANHNVLLHMYEPIDIDLEEPFLYINKYGLKSNWSIDAIDINDNEDSTIGQKVALLKQLLEKHNHELELINFPEEVLWEFQEMESRLKQGSST